MKVKDIMTTQVVTVGPDTKITKVAELMFKNRFHALPVIEENKIIGIIAESDFFTRGADNVFLPSYIDFIKGTKIVDAVSDEKQSKLNKLMNLEARDIMSKECVTILEDMDIAALLEFFRESKFTSIPVTNSEEKLVGIITLADILGLIKT